MARDSDDVAALANLARLLAEDLSTLDEHDLVIGSKQAENIRVRAPEISGRLLAELHRRGHSWPQIARITGITQSTAFRRADPYL